MGARKRYPPVMTKVRAAARRNGIDPRTLRPSTRRDKKVMVLDTRAGRRRWVHFGNPDYPDFHHHGDRKRRANYLRRAGGMPHPRMSPNWLAMRLLW